MSDISQVATNVHRLSNVLGKVADHKLKEMYGFGMSQFKILWLLHKHQEGVLQTTIASWLNQTEAAVSRQVRLLKNDRLIEKRVNPKNRRNHIIMLSGEGKKFAEAAMRVLVKEYKPLFAVLTNDEQNALNHMLERVFFTVCRTLPEN